MKRPVLVALALGSCLAADARVAHADGLEACNSALVRGQELANTGKLLEARAEYPACLRPVCDASLRAVCANFLAELTKGISSLTLESRGAADTKAVRFSIDGTAVVNPSSPIEVNPGTHRVRAEADGHLASETEVTLAKGEHRSAALTLVPITTPHASASASASASARQEERRERTRSIPTSAIILGGVAVVALGSFAYFGLTGKSTESDLRTSCKTGPCDSSAMRREYLAADISALVALISGGGGAWIALGSRSER